MVYFRDFGPRVPAVPQQLLASYYAQGTDGEIQRAEDLPGVSKILSARWLQMCDTSQISGLYIRPQHPFFISKHLESVDTTHLEAQLCLAG